MTSDALLFHEDVYDALASCVSRLGGAKCVGHRLWPHKAPDAAGVQLANCLNRDRAEKLDPEQVLLLLRWGREIGYHAAKHWIDQEVGYAPSQPVEPEDRIADLLRALHASQDDARRQQEALARTIAQLEHSQAGSVAALRALRPRSSGEDGR